jgi:hypothetical protein
MVERVRRHPLAGSTGFDIRHELSFVLGTGSISAEATQSVAVAEAP